MTRPDHQQLARITDPTIELIRSFPRRLAVQLERERRGGSAIPDGYPSSSGGGMGGGHVTVTSVERAVSGRLGALWGAETPSAADEHRRLVRDALAALKRLSDEASLIDRWLTRMEAAATVQAPADEADWCAHHVRHQLFEPVMDGSAWCAWCDGLNRQYGALPPKALLVRRHSGERLTEAAIEASYGTLRQDAARKRVRGMAA